ncbi:hypothetical protein MMC20_003115 [Loxospora ochrophaea]|nr:hypothetical protein [Loxospora ochrophaea]
MHLPNLLPLRLIPPLLVTPLLVITSSLEPDRLCPFSSNYLPPPSAATYNASTYPANSAPWPEHVDYQDYKIQVFEDMEIACITNAVQDCVQKSQHPGKKHHKKPKPPMNFCDCADKLWCKGKHKKVKEGLQMCLEKLEVEGWYKPQQEWDALSFDVCWIQDTR